MVNSFEKLKMMFEPFSGGSPFKGKARENVNSNILTREEGKRKLAASVISYCPL